MIFQECFVHFRMIYLHLLIFAAIYVHMRTFDGTHRRDVRAPGVLLGLVLITAVLRTAGATRAQISAALADPQGYVTAAGADEFVLVLATAIGWLLLAWIALGAALVLGSAAPGWIGWLFNRLARALLPATLRRFVTLGLGITLLSGTSVASAAPPATMAAISVAVDWPGVIEPSVTEPAIGGIPDWPPAPDGAAPGGSSAPPAEPEPSPPASSSPVPPATGSYVVQPGDCLWDIAERTLAQANQPIDVTSVATAVIEWWQANSQIADPDLIFPGQVLTTPIQQP